MKYKLDKGSHSVYALQFNLVMCVEYRRKILFADLPATARDRHVSHVLYSFAPLSSGPADERRDCAVAPVNQLIISSSLQHVLPIQHELSGVLAPSPCEQCLT